MAQSSRIPSQTASSVRARTTTPGTSSRPIAVAATSMAPGRRSPHPPVMLRFTSVPSCCLTAMWSSRVENTTAQVEAAMPPWTNQGAIYDPVKNGWTSVAPPTGWKTIGDAQSVILPNGTYMQADCCTKDGTAAGLLLGLLASRVLALVVCQGNSPRWEHDMKVHSEV